MGENGYISSEIAHFPLVIGDLPVVSGLNWAAIDELLEATHDLGMACGPQPNQPKSNTFRFRWPKKTTLRGHSDD